MNKLTVALALVGVLAVHDVANAQAPSGTAFADETALRVLPASRVPEAAFFVGIGGSCNAVSFTNQDVFAQGISAVFMGTELAATGTAAGPAELHFDTQSRCAPLAQGGYFRHFADSAWLWGSKFSYCYLGSTAVQHEVLIPQAGAFTTIIDTPLGPAGTTTPFTGNVFVQSYEVSINHQLALTPFIGRSFERCFLYGGGGPTLSETKTELKGSIGFANILGTRSDITGAPTNFSSTAWVWGGNAIVGVCYFFDSSWFLDFSYTFALTATPSSTFAAPFIGVSPGFTDRGVVSGNYSGNVITHSLAISINRVF